MRRPRLRLVAALREMGRGLLVDIVPNHLGVARPEANPAWWDELRYHGHRHPIADGAPRQVHERQRPAA